MEQLSIRDWMVIIGGVMIAAVLIDAVRRYWRERRAEIRLNAKIDRTPSSSGEDDAFNLLTELPNGGARIVRRDDLQDDDPLVEREEVATAGQEEQGVSGESVVAPSDPIDVAAAQMAAEEDARRLALADTDSSASPLQTPSADSEPVTETAYAESGVSAAQVVPDAEHNTNSRRRTIKPPPGDADPSDQAIPHPGTVDWLETLEVDSAEVTSPEPEELPVDTPEHGRLPRGADTHVFILYVVARAEEGFSGTDILETLLACDLRFGDMDFFHRHERASGRGPIEFSVANMMKPGVFEIDNMEPLQTRGLMFFVTLPGPADMLKAFDYMYETVKVVAKQLDGDVQDETRSVVTRQSLEHMRQQIRELERRLLVRRN